MGDKSFPSSRRLLRPEEYDVVFNSREYSVNNGLLLVLAKKNNLGFNRLGLIVGKKSLRKAVDRNRIKRQLRESFRQLDSLSLDIVVLVRPGVSVDIQVRKTIIKSLDNLKQKAVS